MISGNSGDYGSAGAHAPPAASDASGYRAKRDFRTHMPSAMSHSASAPFSSSSSAHTSYPRASSASNAAYMNVLTTRKASSRRNYSTAANSNNNTSSSSISSQQNDSNYHNNFGSSASGDFYRGRSNYQNSYNYNNNFHQQIDIENIHVEKNFYKLHDALANVTPEQVSDFRKQNGNIMVQSSDPSVDIPNPVVSFEQAFHCDKEILAAISSQNFEQPTHIQCQVWPIILSGHDTISISQTGSGKTLGFLLPGFVHAHNQTAEELKQDHRNPSILVICPTRELAIQTSQEVQKYAYRGFRSACVYGGAAKGPQIRQISEGVKIIVGTPGRINDFLESRILNLSMVTYLVLDEADVMLDMGFEPQIRSILDRIPRNRQTVMTSATWPIEAKELAARYLRNPIQVNVGEMDLVAAATIKQIIEFDRDNEYTREQHLVEFLQKLDHHQEKILIFVNTKDSARRLCERLNYHRFRCETIHGDLDQRRREAALDALKSNYVNIMTATDVAARGLDISGISYVINYNMPNNIEDYIHRIGRTGRAGKSGTAISYFTRENAGLAKKLISILRKSDQTIDPRLYEMTSLNVKNGPSRYERNNRYNSRSSSSSFYNQNNNYSGNGSNHYYRGGSSGFNSDSRGFSSMRNSFGNNNHFKRDKYNNGW